MDVVSYLLGKQAGGGGSEINNQDKNVTITTNGSSTVTADSGYTGLGTVGITTNVQPNLESKSVTITENTTTTITPTTGKDGLSSVSVTTNVSGGAGDYFANATNENTSSSQKIAEKIITKIPSFQIGPFANSLNNAFSGYGILTSVGEIVNSSRVTNWGACFNYCKSLESVPTIDTSNGTNFGNMFEHCEKLVSIPQLNTSKATYMTNMFYYCSLLENVPVLDFSSVTNSNGLNSMFGFCPKLTNESLNNILASCATASNYTGTKTLTSIGLNTDQRNTCTTLSNYQSFLNAGWSL